MGIAPIAGKGDCAPWWSGLPQHTRGRPGKPGVGVGGSGGAGGWGGAVMQDARSERALFEIFGVDEDDGAYLIIIGFVFLGIATIGCFYCKVYDPLRLWLIDTCRKLCERKPKDKAPPRQEGQPPEEVRMRACASSPAGSRCDSPPLPAPPVSEPSRGEAF